MPINRLAPSGLLLLCLAAALTSVGGCRGVNTPGPDAREYPEGMTQAAVADIQVRRDGPTLTLTNTTAHAFGPSTIWLNSRFFKKIESLGVGETLELDSRTFEDQYGDTFKGGGFFAWENPERLVLAQLETDPVQGVSEDLTLDGKQMIGLVVVDGRPN